MAFSRNMNEMWSEMSDIAREEYKDYFIQYHNGVARTGITGKRMKPLTLLPPNVIKAFEKALLTKVFSTPRFSFNNKQIIMLMTFRFLMRVTCFYPI